MIFGAGNVAGAVPLTTHEALSGIFGSISLTAWIVLLVPQLIENYKQGAADGISLAFLFVWFVGDVTNLVGALWARLVPTVIALAFYFCFADTILISQCLYYNIVNARRARKASALSAESNEEEPLLSRSRSNSHNSAIGLPGSHRRRSSAAERRRSGVSERSHTQLESILEEAEGKAAWVKNSLSILAICAVGGLGWLIAWKSGVWRPVPKDDGQDHMPLGAEVLGYISAIAYLGARIPQIIKNQRDRSCEGLSLLFFLLSLLGNATYGAGILFHSVEKEYFLKNLPWLIGSLGTMVEDGIIFLQFHMFGAPAPSSAVV